ncbi:MAG TPA: NADH-quinone oxidoreductase subunit N [Roseiflexaceae bacterium]|nr:NADH-quinone oxidoreductase subunit N [Roseiflexaceae bacterium]
MTDLTLPTIDFAIVAQPAVVFAWAMLLLLVDLFVDNKRAVGAVALLGTLVAAGVGVALWGRSGTTFGGMITLDNYGLLFNLIFLGVAALTILISLDYLPRHSIERGEYYVLILLATGGMMLLSQGTDLIVLFLGLELLSITLYVLAGFAYPRLASEEAAMKYLLVGAFAAGFLVFGIALVFGATGESNLAAINDYLSRQTLVAESQTLLLIGAALVIAGFGYKIAMAPFHMWTPDVYEGSPTPVAAFMSVGTKAAGFAALTRFLQVALPTQQEIWVPILGALAALTMLVGNITAVTQLNVKRMLAYSSIGHAGYLLLGTLSLGGAGGRGVEGLLFYTVAYALTNLAAFAVLITLERRGEAAWSLDSFAGLWHRQPWLAVAMAVCMLSLAGVPPTAGFWGKFYVFTAAWQAGLAWLALVGVLTSAIAAFFYLRIVAIMFMREPEGEREPRLSGGLSVGIGLATAAILLIGIVPAPVIDLVQSSVLALGR